jgi:hypothetical protein
LLLGELTEPLAEAGSSRLPELEHALAFWTSVSQDSIVRQRLQEQRLPFALYKLLRGQSSDSNSGLLAQVSTKVVTGIVELVKRLVAGHDALEGELADLLIEDLERLSRHRDMDFVNKVFIPLIKVERTLPVTLEAARSTAESGQSAILSDISSVAESDGAEALGSCSFLATTLLESKQKGYL